MYSISRATVVALVRLLSPVARFIAPFANDSQHLAERSLHPHANSIVPIELRKHIPPISPLDLQLWHINSVNHANLEILVSRYPLTHLSP